MALPTNLATMSDVERKAYDDAYHIACVGASNPTGVALTIASTIAKLRWTSASQLHAAGVPSRPESDHHPAVQAMVGQLAYLIGISLGPAPDLMADVETVYLMGQTMPRQDVPVEVLQAAEDHRYS